MNRPTEFNNPKKSFWELLIILLISGVVMISAIIYNVINL